MKSSELAVGLVLLAVLVGQRLIFLDADPPSDFHYHFLTDEGGWAHNARQHALFGQWRLDQDNVPLYGAPLYTFALRSIYSVLGVGLVQTRCLAVLGGLASCLLLYAFVRRGHGWRCAALATFLFGTDFFVVSHHRVAFVESFQLPFILLMLFALALATARWPWAIVAALAWLLACAAKVWAIGLGAIVALFWCALWWRDRRPPWRQATAFGTTVITAGLLTLAVWRFDAEALTLAAQGAWSEATRTSSTSLQPLSAGLLGLTKDVRGQLTPRLDDGTRRLGTAAPIRRSPLLFAIVGLLAASSLSRLSRQHSRRRERTADETMRLLCWCWLLGGLALVASQEYQPDRRYLFLLPPLALLAADALLRRQLALPTAEQLGMSAPRFERLAMISGLSLWFGLMARAPVAEWLQYAGRDLAAGDLPGLTPRLAGALAWAWVTGFAAALLWLLGRWWPARVWRLAATPVVALSVLLQLVPFALYLAHPSFSVRDACRRLDEQTRDWPAERHVMVGSHADTLALDSQLLAIKIRRWPESGFFMNEDGWRRFAPSIVVGEVPPLDGFRLAAPIVLVPERNDNAHFQLPLYIRDDFRDDWSDSAMGQP